ncbi:MAG: hypothetical protein HQ591_10555 [candidate division Zixibacteria bacterium]|nr:hypothetical protein [Candidatus Tariuqbacter arcticus]
MSVAIPKSIRWGVIGLGRCGGNFAEEFYLRGYPAIAINSSHTDLRAGKLPSDKQFFVGLRRQDGAGQDMALGERCLTVNKKRLLESIAREMDDVAYILLTAGLGGGTGSGIGTLSFIMAELDIPMSALTALPWDGESTVSKVNAVRALNKLINSPVNSIALIDNQKILSKAADSPLSELYLRPNRELVDTFDGINRISLNPAVKPLIGFDSEDLKRFFTTRGILLLGKISLDSIDFGRNENLIARLREMWEDGGWLHPGRDFNQATMAGVVILAPPALLKKTSAAHFEKVIAAVKNIVSSSGIYTGIFQTAADNIPLLYTIIAGMPLPERVEQLTRQAKAEGKMLALKSTEGKLELNLDEFSGLDLFSK